MAVNTVSDPWVHAEVVDISVADHTFTQTTRAFSFGVAGTLHVTTKDGTDFTFPSGALATGIAHPGQITVVHDDSTADDIIGYW